MPTVALPRPRRVLLAFALLLAVTTAGAAQNRDDRSAYAISGQVVDARSRVPLRRARVTLSPARPIDDVIFTDDEGRFFVTEAAASEVRVHVSKAGYVQATATISAERGGTEVRVTLARGGAVAGRVADRHGNPYSSATVTANLLQADGSTLPDGLGRFGTRTDRLGEYRLGSLPAGHYEITAVRVGPESFPGVSVEPRLLDRAGRGAAQPAVRVMLRAGDDTRDLDFVLPGDAETCASPPRPAHTDNAAAAISGRITSASGQPLACAAVSVVDLATMAAHETHSGADGQYAVAGLGAGAFLVRAAKANHLALEYGQRGPADLPARIFLRARQQHRRADIALPRVSVISGMVTDEHGEPMAGVPVRGFQLRRIDGHLQTDSVIPGEPTDDSGRYRLIGVKPGSYLVAATVRGAVGAGDSVQGYTTVYHPGTLGALLAAPITVTAGADRDNVNLAVLPASTAVVSGSAADASGRPFAGRLSLSPARASGVPVVDTWLAAPGADGTFAFRHVPPGEYVVKAAGHEPISPQFGVQRVTVGGAGIPPIQIVTTTGATLDGRVTVEGSSCAAIAGLVAVSTVTTDTDFASGAGKSYPAFAGTTGRFQLGGVVGPARLVIDDRPGYEQCYLRTARVNGVEAADRPFDFGTSGGVYRDVEVVVSEASASLEGRIVTDPGVAVQTVWVVVMPVFRDLRFSGSRHLKIARSGADGTFRIAGLPPGDYVAAAVHQLDESTTRGRIDEEVLEGLAAAPRAARVSLRERERRTLSLSLIRP